MQFILYFLLVLPSLAAAQSPHGEDRHFAANADPRWNAHESQADVPVRFQRSGHPENRRRSQVGQNMDGLSSSPRAPPSLPKPGRIVGAENFPPQQDIAGPSGSNSPPPWPPRPGMVPHSEINPVEEEAARFPYTPSNPRRPGTLRFLKATPAEAMAGRPSRPSSPPTHQAITISEIAPAGDPTKEQSPPLTPHSPHSPPPPQSFEIDTPAHQSATRRRCAAIVHAFNAHDMTEEEKRGAAFCCRFLVGACMIGVGAGVQNNFGAGVAVGGAVQWAEALQKLWGPGSKSQTSATHTATHPPTATPGNGSAATPGNPER